MTGQPVTFRAMTLVAPGIVNAIKTKIRISIPLATDDPIEDNDSRLIEAKALWDTGATISCITLNIAKKLKLIPTGKLDVSHAKGTCQSDTYIIDLYLPNGIRIPFLNVLEVESVTGKFDVLIGMDVISIGDFAITNFNGKTKFTFRTPSFSEIDFVKEGAAIKRKQIKKIGRNDPCYCGSGKKFKNCHGLGNKAF